MQRPTLLASLLLAACGTGGGGSFGIGGGGGDGGPLELPQVVPPIKAATPVGFGGSSTRRFGVDAGLSATDFRDRFFNPAGGPTNVFDILAGIDSRLDEINTRSAEFVRPCVTQDPVPYSIVVFGQHLDFVAQCYSTFSTPTAGPPAFMQFGVQDGVTYLFITGGAARVAARVTPVAGSPDVVVDAWYGVGYTNDQCGTDHTFDGCSYAATQIHAEPATKSFEMTVAGIGVGYCGVQMRSDGTALSGAGSPDMGATCATAATLCVSATDLTSPVSCDSVGAFVLPPLGRMAGQGAHVFGASTYPDTPNIMLDGTSSDSLGFGPGDAPASGVGDFDAQ